MEAHMRRIRTLSGLTLLAACITSPGTGCALARGHDSADTSTNVPAQFTHGSADLRGTIFLPSGSSRLPGVVILGGSERGPRTGLKQRLAVHFANAGVAALIYDSAGTGQSTGSAVFQTRDARANEALAAVRCLRREAKVHADRVGILGISEGALVTMLAAARDPSVAFAIPISGGFGIPMMDLARHRIETKSLIRGLDSDQIQQALLLEELLFALMAGPDLFEWRLIDMKAARQPDDRWRKLAAVVRTMRQATLPAQQQEKYDALREALGTFRSQPWFDLVVVDVDRFDRIMSVSAERFYTYLEKGPLAVGDFEKVHQEFDLCSRVRCPVLAVWGENDDFLPPHRSAAFLERCLIRGGNRDAALLILRNADHILTDGNDHFTDGIPDLLTDWLSQRFGPAPANQGSAACGKNR
jgi:pimeloyl-ACP methyl ester carboxylesterase